MSYNIDTFKVKKLENLIIPVSALYKHERSDWHPNKEIHQDMSVTFTNMESEITGVIIDDDLHVSSINCEGEGSGCVVNYMLEPALNDSSGILIASCVWEGGDSINQLIVKDGVVEWVDIDI